MRSIDFFLKMYWYYLLWFKNDLKKKSIKKTLSIYMVMMQLGVKCLKNSLKIFFLTHRRQKEQLAGMAEKAP